MAFETYTHDAFCRLFLGLPGNAGEFVARFVRPDVASLIEPSSVKPAQAAWIDDWVREHRSDLVFDARLRGGRRGYVGIFFDHKSRPDPYAAPQLLRYHALSMNHDLRAGRPLRPMLPIVVYHGQEPWNIPTSLGELFPGPEPLRRHWPDFQYELLDLARMSDDALAGGPTLRAGLLALKHIFAPTVAEEFVRIFQGLAAGSPAERAALSPALLQYLSGAAERLRADDVDRVFRAVDLPESNQMATLREQWQKQGAMQGLQRGLQAGLEGVFAARFPEDAESLVELVKDWNDPAALQAVLDGLRRVKTVAAARRLIAKNAPK